MTADVTARTLQLLVLLQSRPTWSAAELVERTGTSPRTLRRDLQRPVEIGYDVIGRPGPGGHYRLGAGSRLPPMVFEDDEVVALVAGLHAVEPGPAAAAASRALVKLLRVLPRRLATVADAATASIETIADRDLGGGSEDALAVVVAAAASDRLVSFGYTDQHENPSRRRIDSDRCLFSRGRWAVLGYDLDREDWRFFRLDRMTESPIPQTPRLLTSQWHSNLIYKLPAFEPRSFLPSAKTPRESRVFSIRPSRHDQQRGLLAKNWSMAGRTSMIWPVSAT